MRRLPRNRSGFGVPRKLGVNFCKWFVLFGVPCEFQLEHPSTAPEDAGFAAPVFHSGLESGTYGLDSIARWWFSYIPSVC